MNKEKILYIRDALKEQKTITFRLYNAKYQISIAKNNIVIHQKGIDIRYHYPNLKDLLEHYIVYGQPLIELINDIKIC